MNNFKQTLVQVIKWCQSHKRHSRHIEIDPILFIYKCEECTEEAERNKENEDENLQSKLSRC